MEQQCQLENAKPRQQYTVRQNLCWCLWCRLLYTQLVKPGAEEGKLQGGGMCLTLISDEERQDVQSQLCSASLADSSSVQIV